MDSLLPDDEQDADVLAQRFLENPVIAQQVRAESLNLLKLNAEMSSDHAADYEAVFDLIKQEAIDAERSADRALGIRGRVRDWYRAHTHWAARGALQRLSHLVRSVVASLSRR